MEGTFIDKPSNSAETQGFGASLRPKRKLILRDSAVILILVLSTVVLYAITAFLFGSFSQRRAELGKQFAQSGENSLSHSNSAQAIHDLRISLSYVPDDAYNQLLLAEALAQANHQEEARGYFLSLLDLQPADGFLNLQLARLSRQKNDAPQAIRYYRAAAVGNWTNAPLDARFQAQLELSNYLILQHRLPAARAELLIAAADAPATPDAYSNLGDSFLDVNDRSDAVNQYEKALKLDPQDVPVVLKAATVLYQSARYAEAERLLSEARRTIPRTELSDAQAAQFETLSQNAHRIQQMIVNQDLPARQRDQHLLTDLSIAKQRFTACSAKLANANPAPAPMQSLAAEWHAAQQFINRQSSLDDQSVQTNMTQLVFDTEEVTQNLCAPPVGDDALLLSLANASKPSH